VLVVKGIIIDNCLKIIKNNSNYNEIKILEIKYGLEAIYILITKTIIIITLAYFFNLLYESILFTVLYSLIKMPTFGLHATKSWICLVSSSIIFIVLPYLCTFIDVNIITKIIVGIICIIFILKNAPADTYKRPIINKKRRDIYKFISTLIAIVFVFVSISISNIFISNSLIMALIIQNILISPLTYKIFSLPYNNYLRYRPNPN
jgi:accessory gene regulator B